MYRLSKAILPTLAAACTAAALLAVPSSTAGNQPTPCTEDRDLIISSRQHLGHTFSLYLAFNRYCNNRHNRAVLDMQQSAGNAWSVNYIASRCERDMHNRMDAYIDYIDALTEDIENDLYDQCPALFHMNIAYNNSARGFFTNRLAYYRDLLEGDVLAYSTGGSFDAPTINPGVRGGGPGGVLSR